MKNYTELITEYIEGSLSEIERKKFESELNRNKTLREQYDLLKLVNEVMQAKLDIDEINEEHSLQSIDEQTNQLVAEFKKEPSKFNDIKMFVEDSISSLEEIELQHIYQDIYESKVDDVTAEWVKEWDNSQGNFSSLKYNEIRSFINKALSENDNHTISKESTRTISWYKNSFIRIASLSAAATLALLLMVRTLITPASPEKLFESNYQPYSAITSVTRGSSNSQTMNYNEAIVNYRQGNYQKAAVAFDLILKSDTFNIAPHFFSGLSLIELGDYSKAIYHLNKVVQNDADFSIEAQWYLGLTYLKVGDKENATIYLKNLSDTPGYYQGKATKLLEEIH
ncbi:MAG: tol-pal system YbgF family protein [Bacteroidales bacterium]